VIVKKKICHQVSMDSHVFSAPLFWNAVCFCLYVYLARAKTVGQSLFIFATWNFFHSRPLHGEYKNL
jgi:hypothetical protein